MKLKIFLLSLMCFLVVINTSRVGSKQLFDLVNKDIENKVKNSENVQKGSLFEKFGNIESPKPETTTEDPTAITSTEPAAPAQASYILQVRSYPDPDSADARRAEIILNGLSADVVKTVENGQTWYRVFSGPYDSQDAALAAQQTLQHSGIDSIVIKR